MSLGRDLCVSGEEHRQPINGDRDGQAGVIDIGAGGLGRAPSGCQVLVWISSKMLIAEDSNGGIAERRGVVLWWGGVWDACLGDGVGDGVGCLLGLFVGGGPDGGGGVVGDEFVEGSDVVEVVVAEDE